MLSIEWKPDGKDRIILRAGQGIRGRVFKIHGVFCAFVLQDIEGEQWSRYHALGSPVYWWNTPEEAQPHVEKLIGTLLNSSVNPVICDGITTD